MSYRLSGPTNIPVCGSSSVWWVMYTCFSHSIQGTKGSLRMKDITRFYVANKSRTAYLVDTIWDSSDICRVNVLKVSSETNRRLLSTDRSMTIFYQTVVCRTVEISVMVQYNNTLRKAMSNASLSGKYHAGINVMSSSVLRTSTVLY